MVSLISLAPGGMDLTIERPPTTEADQWLWAAERLAFNPFGPQTETLAEYVDLVVKFDYSVGFNWN